MILDRAGGGGGQGGGGGVFVESSVDEVTVSPTSGKSPALFFFYRSYKDDSPCYWDPTVIALHYCTQTVQMYAGFVLEIQAGLRY